MIMNKDRTAKRAVTLWKCYDGMQRRVERAHGERVTIHSEKKLNDERMTWPMGRALRNLEVNSKLRAPYALTYMSRENRRTKHLVELIHLLQKHMSHY